MKLARFFPVVVALGILGAVVYISQTSEETEITTADAAASDKAAEQGKGAPGEGAGTGQGPARPVEVFFLAEETDKALRSKTGTTGNHRPKVNGNRRVLSGRAITSKEDGDFIAPRWSPDGLELLVSKSGYAGLFTVGAQGGDINQVSDKEGIGFSGAWDEDGQISTKNAYGEKQKFNPDGTPADDISIETESHIVGTYTKDDTVWYRGAPGEAAVPVSQGEDRYYGGVVSPDGKYVAYNGILSGIYVQPLDGSAAPVRVGNGHNPVFLPDGSGIVFSYAEDDGHNLVNGDLYYASVDGQNISNLTNNSPGIEVNPSVSPDGRYLAWESNGQIYVGELQ